MQSGIKQLSAGLELYTRTWPATTPQSQGEGAVLLLHGAESHSGWFDEVARQLAAGGLTAFAYDRGGWGQSRGNRGLLASPEAALAEVQAGATFLKKSFSHVHLLGLSWGGLLAAYAHGHLAGVFTSVTLVVPALFPRWRPSLWSLARAVVTGPSAHIALPFLPRDFTRHTDRQAFVAADPYRVASVGLNFFKTTQAMQRAVIEHPNYLANVQVLLAEQDGIIDSDKTKSYLTRHGVRVETFPGTVHSLVLEEPMALARQTLAWAREPMRTAHAS